MNDVAKEVVEILKLCDNEVLKKIPIDILNTLYELANSSNHNVSIDINKSLIEQNLLEESKDLLSSIYYNYLADDKNQILEAWLKNEKIGL